MNNVKKYLSFTEAEAVNQLLFMLRDGYTLVVKVENGKMSLRLFNSAGPNINLLDVPSLKKQFEVSFNKLSIKEIETPYEQEDLSTKVNSQTNSLLVNKNGKKEIIPFSDVLWLEADGNHTLINTANKKHIIRKSLKSLTNGLDKRFQQCHKKYYINLDFLKSINQNSLYLNGGQCIPISRSFQKSFREQMTAYLQIEKG